MLPPTIAQAEPSSTSGADLGQLVEMVQSIADEVDRAAMASTSRAGATWILKLRSQIVNAYTQGQTSEDLRIKTEEEYKRTDVDSRGGYIAGVQIELAGLRIVYQRDENGIEISLIPRSEKIEVQMYPSWINQNFGGRLPGRYRHCRFAIRRRRNFFIGDSQRTIG